MDEPQPGEITQLLKSEKLEEMMPLVYNELRRIADSIFRRERQGHTLQPTALVNEAYLRLLESEGKIEWKKCEKRGGGKTLVSLDESRSESKLNSVEILELHDTLEKLAALDAEQARIVELRFFGGLTLEETAEFLNIPVMRVRREWNSAKLWLYKMLDNSKN